MILKKSLLPCAAILALSAFSQGATISIGTFQADLLKNSSGVAIPQTSLFLLIASTTNAVFSSISPNASTALGSSLVTTGDEFVLFRGAATGGGANGVIDTTIASLQFPGTVPNWDAGDPLALVWFPTLTTASTTIPAGTPYGLYTNAAAVNGSAAWVTPGSGSVNLYFYTKDGTALSPGTTAANVAATGNATLSVVPEPASVSLLGVGLVGMVARRRRSVK